MDSKIGHTFSFLNVYDIIQKKHSYKLQEDEQDNYLMKIKDWPHLFFIERKLWTAVLSKLKEKLLDFYLIFD